MENANDKQCPFINGRILSDHTYAVRNLAFLLSVFPNIPLAMIDGEYEYMCIVACKLLKHQVDTCPDDERWYFENLAKGYKNAADIVERHICKYHPEFFKYLKRIKAV